MRVFGSSTEVIAAVLGALLMRKPSRGRLPSHDEQLDDFITDDLPSVGMKVEVVGYVGSTRHLIPFLCCWTEEGWVVAGTRRNLAFNVAGWRRAGI